MLNSLKFALTVTSATLLSAAANAAITYHVDTVNQEIIFNGSWTGGIPQPATDADIWPSDYSYVAWIIQDLYGPPYNGRSEYPLSGSVSDTEGVTSSNLQYFSAETGQQPMDGVALWFQIIFSEHSKSGSTLTIDNLAFSYSEFSHDVRIYIEWMVTQQTTMTLHSGTHYGDITYQTSPVPEASHIGLVLGVSAVALLIRRRMKNA